MVARDILREVQTLGVRLQADGDRLHAGGPRGAVTPEMSTRIGEHKEEILVILREEAHRAMVADACLVFPGSRLVDGAESYFDAFRALAKRHYPDLDPWDRVGEACRALAEIISTLQVQGDAVGEARARAVWFMLEEMCDRHRGVTP